MNKYFLTCVACILLSTQACSESYLCIPDRATGFGFNKYQKSWVPLVFNVEQKILLKKTDRGWEWSEFGSKYGKLCGEMNEFGGLRCDLFFGEVLFNKNSLRYLETYIAGYVSGEDNNDNTPSITIGRCTPF
jgi:hypothetical protein